MEVKEALLKRRSVRKYTAEKISPEQIDELMHAAMCGPSACNVRPWEFYAVSNPETLEQLHGASRYTKIAAPLAIVVCGNLAKSLPRELAEYWIQDCSAATENILLSALDMGLGTVWCGIYPQPKAVENVKRILNLSDDMIPLNIIYVGHPDEHPEARDQYDESRVHIIK